MPKFKSECKQAGPNNVHFTLRTTLPGFGDMDCQIKHRLEKPEMAKFLHERYHAAAQHFDDLDVTHDAAGTEMYTAAIKSFLDDLLTDLNARLR